MHNLWLKYVRSYVSKQNSGAMLKNTVLLYSLRLEDFAFKKVY